MESILQLLLVIFFVLMNGFFVVAEFAMVKVRKSRIEMLSSSGKSIAAKYTREVVNDLNSYLSACQLGITLASLALGWLGEPAVSKIISPFLHFLNLPEDTIHIISVFTGFAIITGLHIVLGELAPKSLAIINSEKFSTATAIPLVLFYKATYPIMWLFNKLTALSLKMIGYSMMEEQEAAHTDEEIKILVEESYKHGLIDKSEYTYVDNIFEFTEKNARDVMVHRTDMVCLFTGDTFDDLLETVMKEKFTRYPVCDGDKDNVIGFIHVRDLFESKIRDGIKNIDAIIRNIITVPETMSINEMLKIFQKEKESIALVLDEYGGTAGIVSIEDILEEIVGNLSDEYDEEENEIEIIDANTFIVRGDVHLDKISDLARTELPTGEYETISGFILSQIGRIPAVGEKPVVEYEGIVFKVEKTEGKRILLVKVCVS